MSVRDLPSALHTHHRSILLPRCRSRMACPHHVLFNVWSWSRRFGCFTGFKNARALPILSVPIPGWRWRSRPVRKHPLPHGLRFFRTPRPARGTRRV